MFNTEEYIIAWSIYLIAVVGLLGLTWQLTKHIPWVYLTQALRLVVATVLLVPATVDNAVQFLAPAWIKALLTLIFSGVENFLPVGRIILIALLSAALVYIVLLIAWLLYCRYFPRRTKAKPDPQ